MMTQTKKVAEEFPGETHVGDRTEKAASPSALPVGYASTFLDDQVIIEYPWASKDTKRGVITVALFTSMAVVMQLASGQFDWMNALMFGGLAVVLGYFVAMVLINKTRFLLGRGGLTIKHGPLPGRPGLWAPREDIEQLYVHSYDSQQRRRHVLMLKRKSRRKATAVLTGLDTRKQALEIERAIENALRIDNAPVDPDAKVQFF